MNNAILENTTRNERSQRKPDSVVDALLDVGTAWAAHGLKVGKLALETSAMTLGKTAQMLDQLAVKLDRKESEAATPAPATVRPIHPPPAA